MDGHLILPPPLQAAIHADAVDVGYGGTLNLTDYRPGIEGMRVDLGVWTWQYRALHITFRELKAVKFVLQGML